MSQPTGEWVDARALLEGAIAALSPGEMVKAEDTTLTQLMSAIEVSIAHQHKLATNLVAHLELCDADYGPAHRLVLVCSSQHGTGFTV